MLKVENLTLFSENNKTKKYLLKDICFNLDKGDCLGIIGKSGDGKSTLAKALLGIYDSNIHLENGLVTIKGNPFHPSFRGKTISLIFQNPNSYLNPLMKVGKQIDEMLTYHFRISKKDAKQKALNIMDDLGIDNPSVIYHYYPHELSGGMQQRICLCIALICNPDILVLDECTSFLDNQSKVSIINLIKELQQKHKFTLIVISHNFQEIYSLCNKIAIMYKGQIVEFGLKNEIISAPYHPYTLELLYDYLRFHENIPPFTYVPSIEELNNILPITQITQSHYIRKKTKDISFNENDIQNNFEIIKEKIHEIIRN